MTPFVASWSALIREAPDADIKDGYKQDRLLLDFFKVITKCLVGFLSALNIRRIFPYMDTFQALLRQML